MDPSARCAPWHDAAPATPRARLRAPQPTATSRTLGHEPASRGRVAMAVPSSPTEPETGTGTGIGTDLGAPPRAAGLRSRLLARLVACDPQRGAPQSAAIAERAARTQSDGSTNTCWCAERGIWGSGAFDFDSARRHRAPCRVEDGERAPDPDTVATRAAPCCGPRGGGLRGPRAGIPGATARGVRAFPSA